MLAGEGVATRKYDGTCIFLDGQGDWWARREVKPGREAPPNYCLVETDEATGKMVGWEPVDQTGWVKFLDEALADVAFTTTGPAWFELCGPRVNGNPEGYEKHTLVRHAAAQVYEALSYWRDESPDAPTHIRAHIIAVGRAGWEGVVWHHPDGRMAKLKAKDFRFG